jgi:DNA-binding NtrC family response regulator
MSDKKNVLIVDDEPEIGNLLKLFLEDDFNVITFTDPRLACDEIARNSYSLVVSDIKMPFLTGLDVVKHVKKVKPETHVVLITGHAQTERDKAEATELGAAGVLFKPFGDPGKVVDYLNHVLGSRVVLPSKPLAPSPAHVLTTIATSAAKPVEVSGKPLIMAIDDETDLIDVLSMLLSDDFEVRTFNDPLIALSKINEADYKLVMTDLNMPQMPGIDVISQIRKVKPNVPIVIMTGHAEGEKDVVNALKAGGTAVLAKPFPEPNIVLDKIGKLIKK